jgi:rhodanese-related sulfurtransferase
MKTWIERSGASLRRVIVLSVTALSMLPGVVPRLQPAHAAESDPVLARHAAEVEAAYPGVPSIDARDILDQSVRARYVLLDARAAEEIAVSRIPGAVPVDELPATDDPRPILVYCTIGMRSAALARELAASGRNAWNLRGGVLAWAAAGGPFVDDRGEATRRVHVYGRAWNHLPDDHQAVW